MKHAACATAILFGAASPSASVPAQQPTEALSPCVVERVPPPVLCGTLSVLERRENPAGRRIDLNVLVLRATEGPSHPDPVTFLAGGGVLPATRLAPFLSRALADARRSRDILLVDQRGTGGSNPLSCPFELPPLKSSEPDTAEIHRRVDSCVNAISTRADLRAYSTTRAMHDLEQVRSWLGYDQLNVWGLSYGTKAAREFLRLYPSRVRSMVLSGVVPRARAWWSEVVANTDRMLREYYRLCAADDNCRSVFPDPGSALDTLMVRLNDQPVRVNDSVQVSPTDVRRVVLNRLGESWSAVSIPLLMRDALEGDVTPFLPPPRPAAPAIPPGIFYGITCSEEFRRHEAEQVRAISAGTFLGPVGLLQHLAVCAAWPTWEIEPELWEEVSSEVPTLVLNGALDHITPPEYADPIIALLPRSRSLILPLRGHNDFDPCVGSILQRFVQSPDPNAVDSACLAETPALRFPTTKADLPPR